MTPDWPHQTRAVHTVFDAIDRGVKRLVLVAPMGAGKTRIVQRIIERIVQSSLGAVVLTNRKWLVEQLSDAMSAASIPHGLRQATADPEPDALVQISSIQTEYSRVIVRETWSVQKNTFIVFVDEAHLQNNDMANAVIEAYVEAGAVVIGITATPVGLADCYDLMIIAATTSECFECGAIVPVHQFGPDEPDIAALKKLKARLPQEGEDLTEPQLRKLMPPAAIWGRVSEWFEKLNPEHKPAILFASGVPESLWYAENFTAKGIRWAHIDGNDIWLDGEFHRSTPDMRREVLEQWEAGKIIGVSNRFLLREGVDAPWIAHVIFATVFGSLSSYLQAIGRAMRAYPGLSSVRAQDHGGNFWRHGSANIDRAWSLADTNVSAYGIRADRMRAGQEKEPFRCPQCARIWTAGRRCNPDHGGCGYEFPEKMKKSRPVISTDGSLRELTGRYFRPHQTYKDSDGPKLWTDMYWRGRSARIKKDVLQEDGTRKDVEVGWNATFRQAFVLFAQENNWNYPDKTWPLMPLDPIDEYRLIVDVPFDRLVPVNTPEASPDIVPCGSCGAKMFWAKNESTYNSLPIDAEPVENGNIVIVNGVAKYLKKTLFEPLPEGTLRYVSHFSTCPQASKWRKKK